MKSLSLLRVLSLLGFLLLVAPFYQQCSGGFMRQAEAPAEEAPIVETIPEGLDSLAIKKITDSISKETISMRLKDSVAEVKSQDSINRLTPFYQKAYEAIDDETNDNAYEMAWRSVGFYVNLIKDSEGYWNELQKDLQKNKFDLIEMPLRLTSFVFIIIFTISVFTLSFKNQYKKIILLTKWNLILLGISLLCIVFFDNCFHDYSQIKWGYYAFFAVQIGIIYLSRKLLKERNSLAPIAADILVAQRRDKGE